MLRSLNTIDENGEELCGLEKDQKNELEVWDIGTYIKEVIPGFPAPAGPVRSVC